MQSYIEEVGKLATGSAEYAGRSQINILDVLQALQTLGDDFRSIIHYADKLDSKPFALPLPKKILLFVDAQRFKHRSQKFQSLSHQASLITFLHFLINILIQIVLASYQRKN